jgi:hypothetical protein
MRGFQQLSAAADQFGDVEAGEGALRRGDAAPRRAEIDPRVEPAREVEAHVEVKAVAVEGAGPELGAVE